MSNDCNTPPTCTLARLTALLRLANIFRLRGDHARADYYIAKMWEAVDDAR